MLEIEHLWIRHHLQQWRALFLAGRDAGPITSEFQPYRI